MESDADPKRGAASGRGALLRGNSPIDWPSCPLLLSLWFSQHAGLKFPWQDAANGNTVLSDVLLYHVR